MSARTKIWVALWAVYLLWGSTYLGIAIAGETLPLLLAASIRFLCAGSIMALVVLRRGGSMRISRRAFGFLRGRGRLAARRERRSLLCRAATSPVGLASLLIASVPLWVVHLATRPA